MAAKRSGCCPVTSCTHHIFIQETSSLAIPGWGNLSQNNKINNLPSERKTRTKTTMYSGEEKKQTSKDQVLFSFRVKCLATGKAVDK